MTDATATLGNGRFTLHSLLGEGGMARVYRAYDHRLRRWRAIKMLLPEFAQRASVRRRFEAEAQALAVLEHPHIVRIYDVAGSANESYIIMELCEGGAVGDWMLEHGAMPARMAVEVTLAMADGMQAAHEAGIIHRDLKPGNLLIDRRGKIKVTDFGIARTDAVNTTRTGSSMGTIGYMAPEQNDNAKGVDARTDVYALGATLYTLVTGNTDPHLFTIDREPERLNDVPEALRPIIQRAVAFAPADRYPSMAAVAQALSDVRPQLPEMDAGTPPLLQHTPMEVEPPPEPLIQEAPPEPVISPRATVPDNTQAPPPTDPPMSGLVEFEMPADAPEPFLAMTPGTVQRMARPTPAAASTKRFDELYVSDEPTKKPEDDRYVGTMVGWKPKSRDRADLDRAVRAGEAPPEAAHGARVAWLAGLQRLMGFRALGLGLIGGAVFVALIGGSVYTQSVAGGEAIESHRESYWSASRRFHERMEADPVLPQDLTEHGADADVLMQAMASYRSARTRGERRDAAEALAALMSAEYSVLELQDKLTPSARTELGPRVRSIQAERTAVDEARTNWQTAAGTFGGNWALRLGTATPARER